MSYLGFLDVPFSELEMYMRDAKKKREVCKVIPRGRFGIIDGDVHYDGLEGEDGAQHPSCPHCWDYHIEKEKMDNLHMGTQIAYVPSHTGGDVSHPDVEFGFVISRASGGGYFCRYWSKGKEGDVLRTKANSENTPLDCLVLHDKCSQNFVDTWLEYLGYTGRV